MHIDLSPDLVAFLNELKSSVDDLRSQLAAVHAAIQPQHAAPTELREWYSVEEVAAQLGRRPYTVREWCRNGQINAAKKAERRGGATLWMISAQEVARYRDEGLLPISPDRNNVN